MTVILHARKRLTTLETQEHIRTFTLFNCGNYLNSAIQTYSVILFETCSSNVTNCIADYWIMSCQYLYKDLCKPDMERCCHGSTSHASFICIYFRCGTFLKACIVRVISEVKTDKKNAFKWTIDLIGTFLFRLNNHRLVLIRSGTRTFGIHLGKNNINTLFRHKHNRRFTLSVIVVVWDKHTIS